MGQIKLDKDGMPIEVSDGQMAMDQMESNQNPQVKQIVGNNETLKQASLNQAPDAHILDVMGNNEQALNPGQANLLHLSPDPSEVTSPEALNKMTSFMTWQDQLRSKIETAVNSNPYLTDDLKKIVMAGGVGAGQTPLGTGAVDAIGRAFNLPVALSTGMASGVIRSVSGKGTVLDGISDAIKNNTGYDKLMQDLGIPEGPKTRLIGTDIRPLAPTQMIADMTRNVELKKQPIDFHQFGPIMTTRGAVGFGLDVLLNPLTYLEFGTNVPETAAARFGAKSIFSNAAEAELGAKSVARFAGQTLMTDQDLMKGIAALKATKAGHAIMDAMDSFSATTLGKTISETGDSVAKMFLPEYGMHKPTMDIMNQINVNKMNLFNDAKSAIYSTFKDFSPEEKTQYIEEMFNRGQAEKSAKASLGPMSNPKFEVARAAMNDPDGVIHSLARLSGIPDDILRENYIPGINTELQDMLKTAKGKSFAGNLESKGSMASKFLVKPTDLEEAYARRASELANVGSLRHGLKQIIRNFGSTYDEAMKQGFDEFFPRDIASKFNIKGGMGTNLGIPEGEKVFFPKEVMDTITQMADRNKLPTNAALKVYDEGMQQYKAYMYGLWPSTYSRHIFGQQIMRFNKFGWKAFTSGANGDALRILTDSPELGTRMFNYGLEGEKSVPLSTVQKWAKNLGVTGTNQFMLDTGGKMMDKLSDQTITSRIGRMLDGLDPKNNAILNKLRDFGGAVQDHARLTSFMQAMGDGYSKEEAAKMAVNSLINYGNATKAEKVFFRRMFPLYSLTKGLASNMLDTAIQNPGRIAAQFNFFKDLRDMGLSQLNSQQLEAFHEMMKDPRIANQFAVPAGRDKDGNQLWMTGFGTPQDHVMSLLSPQGIANQLTPPAKILMNDGVNPFLQLADTGVVTWKQNYKLNELKFIFNNMDLNTREKTMQFVNSPSFQNNPITKFLEFKVAKRDVFKNGRPTGEKDYEFHANPLMIDLMRQLSFSKFMTYARHSGDPQFDQNEEMTKTMTGLYMYHQNVDQLASFSKYREEQAIGQEYKKEGVGRVPVTPELNRNAPNALKQFNKTLTRFK